MARKQKPAPPPKITAKQLHETHRWITLDEVAHLPGNPNLGDADSLEASIDEFGWFDGIVVHRGVIVAGNHRYDAAVAAGEEGLPGYDLSAFDLDDARRMAMSLAHNRTNRLGSNDDRLLMMALQQITEVDPALATLAGAPTVVDEREQQLDDGDLDDTPPMTMLYRIVVECADEEHQQQLLERFAAEGLTVKAAIL